MISIGDTVKDIRNGKFGVVTAKKDDNNMEVAFTSHGWPEVVNQQFLSKINPRK